MLRRILIAICLSLTATSGLLWLVCYVPSSWLFGYEFGECKIFAVPVGPIWILKCGDIDDSMSTWVYRGKVAFWHVNVIDSADALPPVGLSMAGVQLSRQIWTRAFIPTGGRELTVEEARQEETVRMKWNVRLPLWIPLTGFAVYPAITFIRAGLRRRRRRRRGLCHKCGHNLTGNISGVCPECGAVARVRPDTP